MNTFFAPRGIRNNNPGNIRLSKTAWQGQSEKQEDAEFVQFATPLMGLRALMRLLLTYHVKYSLNTVESIINRYAPPHENATDHYTHQVAKKLGVKRGTPIRLTEEKTLTTLARAIVRHENGTPPEDAPAEWYAPTLYAEAAKIVLRNPKKGE